MAKVEFELDHESLRRIDEFAANRSTSRAEVLRAAVGELLDKRHEAAMDEQLVAGYAANPTGPEEQAWAELSIKGVRAADLDW